MTARSLLSAVRLRAGSGFTIYAPSALSAWIVLLCLLAPRAVAQDGAFRAREQAPREIAPWRRTRRQTALEQERFAQTPARTYDGPVEFDDGPAYQGGYDYDGNYRGNYEYAADGQPPVVYDDGEFAGPPPDGFVPHGEGPYLPESWDEGHSGCGVDWHGFYARADYLLWWSKGFAAPPLVTTSAAGTPREEAGILGLPGTSVLSPNGNFADTLIHGGRVRLGYWIDPCDTAAIEGTYFGFGKSTTHFDASDQDFPILARPFVNIEENSVGNDAELVAFPGLFSGQISVLGSSRLQGAEVIFRHAWCRDCDWRVDWLLGWRFNRIDDTLVISDGKEVLSGETGLTPGTVLTEFDRFSTRNYFNGVQLGVITEWRHCRWWFETRSTLALGNNRSIVTIDGQQTAVVPLPNGGEQVTVTPAGLLAQSTNIGTFHDDNFAVVPQLGINVGWEIVGGLWATFGYNFMYWSRLSRPGDQIDTDVNLSQLSPGGLVGLPRPAPTGLQTDYWAQGINLGLAYRY